jgi:hypothetical protein
MVTPPPANGKKLWRVPRRPLTTSNQEHNTSQECLKNSLKIVAAGKAYLTKRPPLRRPKNQPGKPKDFVFVDLSPVRSEEEVTTKQAVTTTNLAQATGSVYISPLSEASNDSFSVSSDEESMFSLYNDNTAVSTDHNDYNNYANQLQMQDYGLGLSLDDFQFDMTSFHSNFNAYPYPKQQQQQQQQPTLKRADTTPYMIGAATFAPQERKRAVSESFINKTPSPKKPTLSHRHTVSEITPATNGLEAFMMFNDQLCTAPKREITHTTVPRSVLAASNAYDLHLGPYSPITDESEVEDFQHTQLGKPVDFINCDTYDQTKDPQFFDLDPFVSF